MNVPDKNRLTEALQKGRLTSQDEQALEQRLARHPDERSFWEEELSLNQLLKQASQAPVSSNFTARVLEAVNREAIARQPGRARSWNVLRWFPQIGAVTAALVLGFVAFHQHQLAQRREVAQHLAEISRLSGGAPLELLENFEAIQRLNQAPVNVDRELLAALQ